MQKIQNHTTSCFFDENAATKENKNLKIIHCMKSLLLEPFSDLMKPFLFGTSTSDRPSGLSTQLDSTDYLPKE